MLIYVNGIWYLSLREGVQDEKKNHTNQLLIQKNTDSIELYCLFRDLVSRELALCERWLKQ